MDKEQLAAYGIDYEKGLKHCIGDEAFFKVLLSMFLEDTCFARAGQALAQDDRKELFSCMHELKGVSGNAALSALYAAVLPLVELLRQDGGEPEEISRLFARVEAAYTRTCQGINLLLAQP